ncbi:unnamed protein product [Chilo suppressalis]|uniref:PCI domain-containing protein n=1 Tax=Chilo suppressalis TaxID=168631 RepID=A0ABN8ARH1_CHISP|nr:unnamed protein product [Chilo suppressalis]
MEHTASPRKKIKSPAQDAAPINPKLSITCSNVPDGLFDATAAKKHFSKFGRLQRIRLFPKRQMCIIEYDQPTAVERAVLNAGAFDGFMFDVTRSKARMRRPSKKDDDPDWVPDADVEEELSAMSGAPSYTITRQSKMSQGEVKKQKAVQRSVKAISSPIMKKKIKVAYHPSITQPSNQDTNMESQVPVPTIPTSLSNADAAAELHQLRLRVSLTPDEQWRTLEARDKILRGWGGAGSRVKVGGATIGTCQDMCPEKELLHRQAEHQVMNLETLPEHEGQLERWRAVKQYSRSSADQEIPMCYELRPAPVLMRTCAYLLHEIADTTRQVSLADWFHFMWDRLRSIRKDITQQALCCAESIRLVEMCARFHAHCAARLADLEHTQFDQKLNTDNLTKCLQTLKHMYADVTPEQKPNEAEFRGYIALLNLGDANFWWEIKQLPRELQKSEPLVFATQIFNAIDNNNYVRFFRLVQHKASYLQACILLRYFNDVRARALARIVKAYAPRGGSRFPAEDLMDALAFESIENMNCFINHYGLRFAKTDDAELTIILDRNQFIEDSDPYPIARAISLIESKRRSTVGEVIAGGPLPNPDFRNHVLYTSFNKDGRLKESALLAEDQGYDTKNDSYKDVQALRAEINKLVQGEKDSITPNKLEQKTNLFVKPELKTLSPSEPPNTFAMSMSEHKQFSFKPAIPVASTEIIKNSPERIFGSDCKNVFSFSKPQETLRSGVFPMKNTGILFKSPSEQAVFDTKVDSKNIFSKNDENKDPFKTGQTLFSKPEGTSVFKQNTIGKVENTNLFKSPDFGKSDTLNIFKQQEPQKSEGTNIFKQQEIAKNVFSSFETQNKASDNIFAHAKDNITFAKPDSTVKSSSTNNIFGRPTLESEIASSNIFGVFNKQPENRQQDIFSQKPTAGLVGNSIFAPPNGEVANNKLSPGSLFKNAVIPQNGPDSMPYSIFQRKNRGQSVADNIFNSVGDRGSVYDFNASEEDTKNIVEQRYNDEKVKQEQIKLQEQIKREEEERKKAMIRQEEERRILEILKREEEEKKRKEEERRKEEELKQIEEKRKREEERKQEELRKKIEEDKKAELKRKAEEAERKFKERVGRETTELLEELVNELCTENVSKTMEEELEKFNNLMSYANSLTEEIITEFNNETCQLELKAEQFWGQKLRKKWFKVWKDQLIKNIKRRDLLENTPVWLTSRTPLEEAQHLRRMVENAALKNMNAIHRGYKFNGELKLPSMPEPYNLMEIIRSSLLKRMKQINYPYDKCFFWKISLVSPGTMKWLYRKVNIEKWLLDVFSDSKKHDASDSLIHVSKQSWNRLMDFAISVSLTDKDKINKCGEAIEGTNGLLMYSTEHDNNLTTTLESLVKLKYSYQILPVAIIAPKSEDLSTYNILESLLSNLVNNNAISAYKIYIVEPDNIFESLNLATKTALKWLAKKFPQNPPTEIDLLKSICQRYLGNEIWCRFKSERDSRMSAVLKDLPKLVDCYNNAVEKLTDVITNEDLFNYPSFPLEFKVYLDNESPYPKPYEFIPCNVKTSENVSAIKDIMKQLKLPCPVTNFNPINVTGMQQEIRKYCYQIGWFENPEEVTCRVVALLPNEFSDLDMPSDQFSQYFARYDLIDILNIIVYEKISRLNNFDNRYAIYEKSVLEDYRNIDWLYNTNVLSKIKHKAIENGDDELDFFIEAKRRKIAMDSIEYLMIEDKDSTMVEENIKATDDSISRYNSCSEAVKQLEEQIENEKQKSLELENLLKLALLLCFLNKLSFQCRICGKLDIRNTMELKFDLAPLHYQRLQTSRPEDNRIKACSALLYSRLIVYDRLRGHVSKGGCVDGPHVL